VILNRQRAVRVPLPPLERFLRHVRRELRLRGRQISICFVTDAEITRLNRMFRGKNRPTDVLSFPAGPSVASARASSPTSSLLGDIAISPATARRNARRFGRTLPDELRILILHGVLHLLGYDHESDAGRMDRVESRLRRRLRIHNLGARDSAPARFTASSRA
jgi:probable rRNA maturation factor